MLGKINGNIAITQWRCTQQRPSNKCCKQQRGLSGPSIHLALCVGSSPLSDFFTRSSDLIFAVKRLICYCQRTCARPSKSTVVGNYLQLHCPISHSDWLVLGGRCLGRLPQRTVLFARLAHSYQSVQHRAGRLEAECGRDAGPRPVIRRLVLVMSWSLNAHMKLVL